MAKFTLMESKTTGDAQELLERVAGIRASTRNDLSADAWQWLMVWALVFIGAGITAVVPALEQVADWYWIVMVPIALIITLVIAVRSDFNSRVRRKALPYILVSLSMTVGAFGVSYLLEASRAAVVVWIVLGFGFAALAWLEKQRAPAVLFAALGILAALLALVADDSHDLYPLLAFAFGAAIGGVAAGLKIQADR